MRVEFRMARGLIVLGAAFVMSACGVISGPDTNTTKDPGPVNDAPANLDNLADKLWTAFCERKLRCGQTTTADVAACINENRKAAHSPGTARRWGTPEDLVKSIQGGVVKFDAEQATRCADSLKSLACNATTSSATLPFETAIHSFPDCDAAFQHTNLKRGSACLTTWACQAGFECVADSDACVGSCETVSPPEVASSGNGCLRDSDCDADEGEQCFFNVGHFNNGTYEAPSGSSSTPSTHPAEGLPTLATSTDAGGTGVCLSSARVTKSSGKPCAKQVVDTGDPTDLAAGGDAEAMVTSDIVFDVDASIYGCEEGYYCQTTSTVPSSFKYAFTCKKLEMEPTDSFATSPACVGMVCSGDMKCVPTDSGTGKCVLAKSIGAECEMDPECQGFPAVGCVAAAELSGKATCRVLPEPGKACVPRKGETSTGPTGCNNLMGYCNGGTGSSAMCVKFRGAGERCVTSGSGAKDYCSPADMSALIGDGFPGSLKCTSGFCDGDDTAPNACE